MIVKHREIAVMFPFPYLADYGGKLQRRSQDCGLNRPFFLQGLFVEMYNVYLD